MRWGDQFSWAPSRPSLPRCKRCCLDFEATSKREAAWSQLTPHFSYFLHRVKLGEKHRAQTHGPQFAAVASSGGSRERSACPCNPAISATPRCNTWGLFWLLFGWVLFFVFPLFFFPLDEFSSQTGTSGQSRSARSGVLGVELAKAN